MGNVHFSGRHRDIPSYVLNSQQDNVFEKNNIRFHIDGHYLSDFSDKGIERFIEKHYNDKTGFLGCFGLGWGGKDLEFKEVKAFIQAAAANADQMQGMTFDLTDADLGLFDDDDVKVDDIRHSFDMQYKTNQGSSDPTVSFVDATDVSYDMRTARKDEERAHGLFKEEQTTHRGLQKTLQKATKERDKIASRIGDNAMQKLAEIDSKMGNYDQQLSDIDTDLKNARLRLSQQHIPASEKRELRLMIRGLDAEKKDVVKERDDFKKSLTKKHGFWSFLGFGSTLEDLRAANQKVKEAQKALDAHKPDLESARDFWQKAVHRREAVENGASLKELDEGQKPADPPADPNADTATPAPADDTATPPAQTPDPANAAAPANADPSPSAGAAEADQLLRNLLDLPAEARLETLQQIPPEKRMDFLKVADEYLQAGRANNPLGLDPQTFQQFAAKHDEIGKLHLNALLSWGDPTQQDYLSQADDAAKAELAQELDQKLFDQQLAAQAAALKSRLAGASPETETIPRTDDAATPAPATATPAPDQAQPTPGASPNTGETETVTPTPDASATPTDPAVQPQTSPLNLETFSKLPMSEQLKHFLDLPPADQDLAFSSQNSLGKNSILLELAANNMADQATLQRLINLMQPQEKQEIVNSYADVLKAHEGQPYPRKTAMNNLLHLFAEQGVHPGQGTPVKPDPTPTAQATNPEVTETQAAPTPDVQIPSVSGTIPDKTPAPQPTQETPTPPDPNLVQYDSGNGDPVHPVVEEGHPDSPAAPPAPTPPQVDTTPPKVDETPAETATAEVPPSQPPADDDAGLTMLKQLLAIDPVQAQRAKAFATLPLDAKQAVMASLEEQKQVDPQSHTNGVLLQAELLAGLEFLNTNDPDLSTLIAGLSETSHQEVEDNLKSSIAAVQAGNDPPVQKRQTLDYLQSLLKKFQGMSSEPQTPAETPATPSAPPAELKEEPAPQTSATPGELARKLAANQDRAGRQKDFANLGLETKKAVFEQLPLPVQEEMLTALVQLPHQDGDRQALIAEMGPVLKSTIAQDYTDALPALQGNPDLTAAMKQVLTELGVKVTPKASEQAPPPGPSNHLEVDGVTGAAVKAPPETPAPAANQSTQAPETGRMDMSSQIGQLKQVVATKTWMGMGGVADTQTMNQLVEQIWGLGNRSSRDQMAKVLIESGQAQTLGNLLVNGSTSEEESLRMLTQPGFPADRFMKDIDDSRSYLVLRTLAQAATKSDGLGEKARQLILNTINDYDGYIKDREGPFERMKNSAVQEGVWEKLPQAIRTKIDDLLAYW